MSIIFTPSSYSKYDNSVEVAADGRNVNIKTPSTFNISIINIDPRPALWSLRRLRAAHGCCVGPEALGKTEDIPQESADDTVCGQGIYMQGEAPEGEERPSGLQTVLTEVEETV